MNNIRQEILNELSKIIYNHQELRIGQILTNCFKQDPFYFEDKKTLELIKQFRERLENEY